MLFAFFVALQRRTLVETSTEPSRQPNKPNPNCYFLVKFPVIATQHKETTHHARVAYRIRPTRRLASGHHVGKREFSPLGDQFCIRYGIHTPRKRLHLPPAQIMGCFPGFVLDSLGGDVSLTAPRRGIASLTSTSGGSGGSLLGQESLSGQDRPSRQRATRASTQPQNCTLMILSVWCFA